LVLELVFDRSLIREIYKHDLLWSDDLDLQAIFVADMKLTWNVHQKKDSGWFDSARGTLHDFNRQKGNR
jgi:hypothetical protein